ncbi:hypothetical protein [Cellulomonas fimi]|uniref:Nucleoside diphosphate kinase-like domain-containing protein n=1 Tax=Cellulomonas fimi (strain ATCC 484 / DSM 20113 / JCM 1341 / CCUG 24087 / LMG 16345 / NBRC 15513 / NCIMB 8980 / NCTC 7547 / NRS-133) TaxID=590998 RepID=F4H6D2_CELFA|nr:hypothetical protein [Cellulomonas fimi]AEE44444.1 hypothetical protein Celf_0299 [Cellulomonas fimi ATCC 484]NNH06656.1 hypothetical protein [Cellulomonas fimi]VEH26375.1 Uncharacterised protein [Cellulomonas fimi]
MSIDPRAERGGTRWALACLTPDALRIDAATHLLDALDELGFEVDAASLSFVRAPEVARLYAHNLGSTAPGRVDGTWLGREIYALGPSLKLLLSHREEGADHLLASAKGPSAWGDRDQGHLRSRVGLANKSFSMIHTPDSALQAWDDLDCLFGPGAAAALRSGVRVPVPWERLRRLAAPLAFSRTTPATSVVEEVVARAEETIATDARLWVGAAVPSARDAAEALLRRPRAPHAALHDRLYALERTALAEAVHALRRGEPDPVESDALVELLLRTGVLPDPWAAQLVRSVLVFPPAAHA